MKEMWVMECAKPLDPMPYIRISDDLKTCLMFLEDTFMGKEDIPTPFDTIALMTQEQKEGIEMTLVEYHERGSAILLESDPFASMLRNRHEFKMSNKLKGAAMIMGLSGMKWGFDHLIKTMIMVGST